MIAELWRCGAPWSSDSVVAVVQLPDEDQGVFAPCCLSDDNGCECLASLTEPGEAPDDGPEREALLGRLLHRLLAEVEL